MRGSELSQLLLPGWSGRFAEPERAGVDRLEARRLEEHRRELAGPLAVVASDAHQRIVGQFFGQEIGLRGQHFLRAEQVGVEIANRLEPATPCAGSRRSRRRRAVP